MTDTDPRITRLDDRSLLVLDDDNALRTRLGRALESRGFDVVTAASIAEAQAALGERGPAEAQLRALNDVPDHYVYKATLYAGLRDRENCLRYLELGVPLGIAPEYLKISPLFSFLRGEPRFQEVLRQLGLA